MGCAFARVALLATLLLTLGLLVSAGGATGCTLAEALRASGVRAPSDLPDLDRQVEHVVLARDAGVTVMVYAVTREPLAWPPSAPDGLDPLTCARLDSATRHAGAAVIVTAHVNPSAACTLVLAPDLRLQAVLGGWLVATLPDGRLLYERNQIHFAAVHPLALGLFDPAGPADTPFYPHPPYEHPEMGARGPRAFGGTPVSLMLYVEDADAAVKAAVAAGAQLLQPVARLHAHRGRAGRRDGPPRGRHGPDHLTGP